MRPRARTPRYFHPWDPLQLPLEVDSGLRVKKNAVAIPVFRTFKGPVYWTPLLHGSWGIFSGRERGLEVVEDLSRNVARSKGFGGSLTLEGYSYGGQWSTLFEALDEELPSFRFHPLEGSFLELLGALVKHRRALREATEALGASEAPNKQLQVLLFPLSEEVLEAVRTPQGEILFLELLRGAAQERLYPLLLGDAPRALPLKIHEALSWGAYLEEAEPFLLETLAPGVPMRPHSFTQLYLGSLRDAGEKSLIPLHPWKRTPSQWQVERKDAQAEEEALYREFLEALDDGT